MDIGVWSANVETVLGFRGVWEAETEQFAKECRTTDIAFDPRLRSFEPEILPAVGE